MTKAKAIAKTEYTEKQLIDMALVIAQRKMADFRDNRGVNQSTTLTLDDWNHYNDLVEAFEAILQERKAR